MKSNNKKVPVTTTSDHFFRGTYNVCDTFMYSICKFLDYCNINTFCLHHHNTWCPKIGRVFVDYPDREAQGEQGNHIRIWEHNTCEDTPSILSPNLYIIHVLGGTVVVKTYRGQGGLVKCDVTGTWFMSCGDLCIHTSQVRTITSARNVVTMMILVQQNKKGESRGIKNVTLKLWWVWHNIRTLK